ERRAESDGLGRRSPAPQPNRNRPATATVAQSAFWDLRAPTVQRSMHRPASWAADDPRPRPAPTPTPTRDAPDRHPVPHALDLPAVDTSRGPRARTHAGAMVRRPAALPSALPWPVFSRAEALRAGVPDDRLRRPDLERLRRGLYARRDIRLDELHIAAALCRQNRDLVIVGLSAARLLRVPMPAHLERWERGVPVEVATSSARGRSDPVVRWHALSLAAEDIQPTSYRLPLTGD